MFNETEELAGYTLETLQWLLLLYDQSKIDNPTFIQNVETKLEFLEFFYSKSRNPDIKAKAAKIMRRCHEIKSIRFTG